MYLIETPGDGETAPRDYSQAPFRLLLSPKSPHVIFGARINGNSDYKRYLKIKEEVEQERGVRCAEVIITRGEFKFIPPEPFPVRGDVDG